MASGESKARDEEARGGALSASGEAACVACRQRIRVEPGGSRGLDGVEVDSFHVVRDVPREAGVEERQPYAQVKENRRFLALALGVDNHGDPEQHAEVLEMRPQIAELDFSGRGGRPQAGEGGTPACEECMTRINSYLVEKTLEQGHLEQCVAALNKQHGAAEAPGQEVELDAEIERLIAKQSEAVAELQAMESDFRAVEEQAGRLATEELQVAQQESAYWHDFTMTRAALDTVSEKRDSLMRRIRSAEAILGFLSPIHAFNDAFFIWRDGEYGTINQYRLGQLLAPQQRGAGSGGSGGSGVGRSRYRRDSAATAAPRPPPCWDEVNTAWGLSAMLLAAIAQYCGFEFAGFRVCPLGARTTLVQLASGKVFPLYLDSSRSNTMMDRLSGIVSGGTAVENFNHGMRAFMVCLAQLTDVAKQSKEGAIVDLEKNMYPIKVPGEANWNDRLPPDCAKIKGVSVDLKHAPQHIDALLGRTQPGSAVTQPSAQDVDSALRWTLALRRVLTNLKWLLVWSVKSRTSSPVL